jgi:DNA polymerase
MGGEIHHVLHRDYETRGVIDLARSGARKYAADRGTEIMCAAFAVDGGPVRTWVPGQEVPPEFLQAAREPHWVVAAHGDWFESSIEDLLLGPRFGWPRVLLSRHRCTMAMCLAQALPAKLELAAEALDLLHQKDKAGHRLMRSMSKPRRPRKGEDAEQGPFWFEDPDRFQRLLEYNIQDVEVERELYNRLRLLSDSEQQIWELDQRINLTGFRVDRNLAEAASKIAAAAQPEIDAELGEITDGLVTRVNQVARQKAWLQTQGCTTKALDKQAVQKLLATTLPAPVKRALELRTAGAHAAAKKINALLSQCGEDNRIRGALKHHAASTGRWGGNGFQPQNLKRPQIDDIDTAVAAISTGDYEHVRSLYKSPLAVVGDIARSLIIAAPSHVLIGADFSSVESRVLAWTAGEDWKLDAYRRYDATQDPRDEPYTVTAARILRKPAVAITAEERNVGKVADLSFGYQGGLNAFRKFEPEKFTDEEVQRFKDEWRDAHPRIRRFWHGIDSGAWRAVRERGNVIHCGRIAFKCAGAFLFLKLPSGRKLAYPYPRIVIEDPRHQSVVFKDNAAGGWRDCCAGNGAYGGLWTENIVQAISRDLLADAMLRIEAAGYPIVLHVHDEVVAEVPQGFGSTKQFTRLMTRVPAWAEGLPIAARAWTGQRFCKS